MVIAILNRREVLEEVGVESAPPRLVRPSSSSEPNQSVGTPLRASAQGRRGGASDPESLAVRMDGERVDPRRDRRGRNRADPPRRRAAAGRGRCDYRGPPERLLDLVERGRQSGQASV